MGRGSPRSSASSGFGSLRNTPGTAFDAEGKVGSRSGPWTRRGRPRDGGGVIARRGTTSDDGGCGRGGTGLPAPARDPPGAGHVDDERTRGGRGPARWTLLDQGSSSTGADAFHAETVSVQPRVGVARRSRKTFRRNALATSSSKTFSDAEVQRKSDRAFRTGQDRTGSRRRRDERRPYER